MCLSNPPETIRISETGDKAIEVAGDWWTFANSAIGDWLNFDNVFHAATVPLLNAAASNELLALLIFKSRKP